MSDPDRGIDFVDDGDPGGGDEDLPQRAPASWRARGEAFLRGRYGVPLVVVVLVLAYLVGRALLHERPAGAPPVGPAPSSSSVTLNASTGRVVVDLPLRTGPDPTRCPGLRCYTSPTVPVAVRTAVREAFPGARFTAAETIRLIDPSHGDPLWYREVVAQLGTATLTLRVQAHSAGDTPDGNAGDNGSQSLTSLDARLQQYFVRADVLARSGSADVLDRLGTLIADDRLLGT